VQHENGKRYQQDLGSKVVIANVEAENKKSIRETIKMRSR